jgi:hypothetical protein
VSLILILLKRHPPQKTHLFYTVAFFEQKCHKQKFHEKFSSHGYYIFLVSVGLGNQSKRLNKHKVCSGCPCERWDEFIFQQKRMRVGA